MTTALGKALAEARRADRDADTVAVIGSYIESALWPWGSGGATVYTHYDTFELRGVDIWIETKLLPQLRFVIRVDPFRYNFNEEALAHKIGEEAFNFYRNRPALPVDDHIILGEE